jgi:arylsulfatase
MTRRNVVLITVDSLRADHCGYLDDGGLTPTLDDFTADGLAFANAIAPGTTTVGSIPTILTGEEVHDRRHTESIVAAVRQHVRTHQTLGERMRRLGYETGAFVANPWASSYFGFDAGFDTFEDFLDADREQGVLDRLFETPLTPDRAGGPLYAARMFTRWLQERHIFQTWNSFYDDVLAWTETASRPYFLWVYLVDAHMPYLPPAARRRDSKLGTYGANLWLYSGQRTLSRVFQPRLRRAYEDTVAHVDETLDRLRSDLAGDEPLYVVHADHGEELGEHGTFGHGNHLVEEQIHVPLVVGNGPTGRIERPFSLASLPSLVTALATGDVSVSELGGSFARARTYDGERAIRARDWKYVRTDDDETVYSLRDGEQEIYDTERRALGAQLVDRWEASTTERESLTAAADAFAREDSPL